MRRTGKDGRAVVRLELVVDCRRCELDGATAEERQRRADQVYRPGLCCTLPHFDASRWTGDLVTDYHAAPLWDDDDPIARISESGCAGGWITSPFVASLAHYRPVVRSGGMAPARLPTADPVILDALAVLDDAAAATSMAFTEATLT